MLRWVNSPASKAVAKALIAARKERGLTQRDVAARTNLAPSIIAKIEMGERRVDVLEFVALARALGIDELELLAAIRSSLS